MWSRTGRSLLRLLGMITSRPFLMNRATSSSMRENLAPKVQEPHAVLDQPPAQGSAAFGERALGRDVLLLAHRGLDANGREPQVGEVVRRRAHVELPDLP